MNNELSNLATREAFPWGVCIKFTHLQWLTPTFQTFLAVLASKTTPPTLGDFHFPLGHFFHFINTCLTSSTKQTWKAGSLVPY